jgi:predicted DNA-binding transcriptional regulator AlpA
MTTREILRRERERKASKAEERERRRVQRRIQEEEEQRPQRTMPPRIAIRFPAVMRMANLRRTAIKKAVKEGRFPRPFTALEGGRFDLWWEDEVAAHLEARAALRDGAAAPAAPDTRREATQRSELAESDQQKTTARKVRRAAEGRMVSEKTLPSS